MEEAPIRHEPNGATTALLGYRDCRRTCRARAVTAVVLAATAWITVAAVLGPQDGRNALPGVFYVLLWVGVVAASLLCGPVWRVLSPVRAAYRLLPLAQRPPPWHTRDAGAIGPLPQDCTCSSGWS